MVDADRCDAIAVSEVAAALCLFHHHAQSDVVGGLHLEVVVTRGAIEDALPSQHECTGAHDRLRLRIANRCRIHKHREDPHEHRPEHVDDERRTELRHEGEKVEAVVLAVGHGLAQTTRCEVNVSVTHQEPLAGGVFNASREGVRLAEPARGELIDVQRHDAAVLSRKFIDDRSGRVSRAVIHHDHLQRRVVVVEACAQRVPYRTRLIARRNDRCNRRPLRRVRRRAGRYGSQTSEVIEQKPRLREPDDAAHERDPCEHFSHTSPSQESATPAGARSVQVVRRAHRANRPWRSPGRRARSWRTPGRQMRHRDD